MDWGRLVTIIYEGRRIVARLDHGQSAMHGVVSATKDWKLGCYFIYLIFLIRVWRLVVEPLMIHVCNARELSPDRAMS